MIIEEREVCGGVPYSIISNYQQHSTLTFTLKIGWKKR
jgi:hypothetical protein